MATRGSWGFVIDGQSILTYNHCDSYPSGLGNNLLADIKIIGDINDLEAKAIALKSVDMSVPPTQEQKDALEPYADLGVSEQTLDDWYCLLRRTQGSLEETLKCGYIALNGDFTDEWTYVINFDTNKFEVYDGDIPLDAYPLDDLPEDLNALELGDE